MKDSKVVMGQNLSSNLRLMVASTAVINLVIGLAFLFGPELEVTLWPTPVPAVLMRFIGAIILGNGVGAWLISRQGTWEGARAIFAIALVYGVVVLPALIYHLILGSAPAVLWVYAFVDALFLGPIVYIFWKYEQS